MMKRARLLTTNTIKDGRDMLQYEILWAGLGMLALGLFPIGAYFLVKKLVL